MTWLLMLGLLLASALLSAAETAVFSLQPADRRRLVSQHRAAAALLRNLYRGTEARESQAHGLARYVFAARGKLAVADIGAGHVDFGILPKAGA